MNSTQKIGTGVSIVGGAGMAMSGVYLLAAAKATTACGAALATVGGVFLLAGVIYLFYKVDLQCIPGLPFSQTQRMIMDTPEMVIELDGQLRRLLNTIWPGKVWGVAEPSSLPPEAAEFLAKLDSQKLTFQEINQFFQWVESSAPMDSATKESVLEQIQLIRGDSNEFCQQKGLPTAYPETSASATMVSPLLIN
jgi:hypothetical protein